MSVQMTSTGATDQPCKLFVKGYIFTKPQNLLINISALAILPAPISMKHYRPIECVDSIWTAAMAPLFESVRPLYLLPRCVSNIQERTHGTKILYRVTYEISFECTKLSHMSRCGPNDLFVCSMICFQSVLDCIEDFVSQWCYCPARGVQERRRFSCSEIGAFFFLLSFTECQWRLVNHNVQYYHDWTVPTRTGPKSLWHLLQRAVRVRDSAVRVNLRFLFEWIHCNVTVPSF